MSQKRQPEEAAAESTATASPEEKRLKVPSFKQVVTEVVRKHHMQKFLSALEPLVRKVVKEEVELALANHLCKMTGEYGEHQSTSRSLQLQFVKKISLPIFTGARIEGEDCSVLSIALVDSLTGQVVKSGSESSMKVEIVVLEGDFDSGEDETWTMEEFKVNIVREREGKRSLLTGDLFINLSQGIGLVGELSFTDNSSWTRSRKFRLGARVSDGYFNETRVREARSEPFVVKDHRGELYKKHYPPTLGDEVWRLEKIGKDGAFHKRLSCENINTVKDFLTLLYIDAPKLRNILGSGMSAKMWEITAEHAGSCTLTNQMYLYLPNNQSKTGVVFNIVGEVMGLLSEQQFVSVNELPDNEKSDAHSLVKLAFNNWNAVVAYDTGAGIGNSSEPPLFSGSEALPQDMYSHFSSLIKPDGFGYTDSNVPSPDIFSIGYMRGFDGFMLPSMDNLESPNLGSRDSCSIPRCPERMPIPDPLIFDECGSHSLLDEDSLQYLVSDNSLLSKSFEKDSPADLGTAVTGFFAMSARSAAREKANTGWATLVSLLRWRFSIKRLVGSKKHRINGG